MDLIKIIANIELDCELKEFYVDNGYSGTSLDRPGFNKLLDDITQGKINMIMVKDLSRLGRDYIETGEYIEKYFPTHNIRYISLLDGIDTISENNNNDIAPFKAVINDMYSKDNSKKIRTALKTMQLKGKWVGGCPPFGYMNDPDDKNHLIPNKDESEIVKKIFHYAENGKSYYQIAELLTHNKIPTSSMLRNNKRKGKLAILGIWSPKTIKTILSNEIYVGDMVQNKNNRISYKIRQNKKNPKEMWIIVKNTHTPLVDREVFNKIQLVLSNTKIRANKEIYRLLDGLLYCHECGHKISILKPRKSDNKTYIACNYYKMHSKDHLCTPHSYNYDLLEEIVLNNLKEIISKYKKDIIIKIKEKRKNNKESDTSNIKIIIKEKEDLLDKMYIDYLQNKIDYNMYERIKNKINIELKELIDKEEIIKNNNSKILNNNEKINSFFDLININRSIILKLINRIEIHKDKSIDIHYNFQMI